MKIFPEILKNSVSRLFIALIMSMTVLSFSVGNAAENGAPLTETFLSALESPTSTAKVADLARKGGDHVLRGVDGDGDDVDVARAVGNAHAADDVFAEFVQQGVETFDGIGVFDNNAHNGNALFHSLSPPE